MTESVPFDFIRAPLARKRYNLTQYGYSDSDFDGTAKWEMVMSPNCPDNVADCLSGSSTLKSGFTKTVLGDIKLQLTEYDDYNVEIKIKETVSFTIDSDVDVKGFFLRKKDNGMVLGYCINVKPVRFCQSIIFEADNVLWTVIG